MLECARNSRECYASERCLRLTSATLNRIRQIIAVNLPLGLIVVVHFYKSALYSTLRLIDDHLSRWAQRKFRRLRRRPKRARTWLAGVVRRTPGLFPHWRLLYANGRMLGAV